MTRRFCQERGRGSTQGRATQGRGRTGPRSSPRAHPGRRHRTHRRAGRAARHARHALVHLRCGGPVGPSPGCARVSMPVASSSSSQPFRTNHPAPRLTTTQGGRAPRDPGARRMLLTAGGSVGGFPVGSVRDLRSSTLLGRGRRVTGLWAAPLPFARMNRRADSWRRYVPHLLPPRRRPSPRRPRAGWLSAPAFSTPRFHPLSTVTRGSPASACGPCERIAKHGGRISRWDPELFYWSAR